MQGALSESRTRPLLPSNNHIKGISMKSIFLAIAFVALTQPVLAQRWQWPDNPKNVQVLPKSATGRELQRTMFSFTAGLGVRCTYCHVGEEGRDFSEYDFPSDVKPEKNKARIMIKMMSAVNNEYLAAMHVDSSSALKVACITCHRGNATPVMLEDKLKRSFDRNGIDSTLKQYRALRDQFYGGFTYNFKDQTLVRLAEKILEDSTKSAAAIQVLKLNIELYPASAFSYARLGGIFEAQGNAKEAIENYEQAVKLDPNNRMAKRQLERLQGKK